MTLWPVHFLLFFFAQELNGPNYEDLLKRIQCVVDDRTKVVKGKIGMQRQRFSAIKTGVNLMLDVCRQTHVDLEVEIEGGTPLLPHVLFVHDAVVGRFKCLPFSFRPQPPFILKGLLGSRPRNWF